MGVIGSSWKENASYGGVEEGENEKEVKACFLGRLKI